MNDQPAPAPVDWIEEGRKHFVQTQIHPDRPPVNYPTQDVHTPKQEADFILGFNAKRGEWAAGNRLSGIAAYVAEHDERTSAAAGEGGAE